VQGYESTSWFGLFARAGTPPAAIATINTAVNEGLREPALAARLTGMGVEPVGGPPADFRRYVTRRFEETGTLIRDARITAD